jgi:hypothetical protein
VVPIENLLTPDVKSLTGLYTKYCSNLQSFFHSDITWSILNVVLLVSKTRSVVGEVAGARYLCLIYNFLFSSVVGYSHQIPFVL